MGPGSPPGVPPAPALVLVRALGVATAAVFLYAYVDVGRLGPLPDLYDPTWDLPGKRASAVAETVATGLSVIGLAFALRVRRSHRRAAP